MAAMRAVALSMRAVTTGSAVALAPRAVALSLRAVALAMRAVALSMRAVALAPRAVALAMALAMAAPAAAQDETAAAGPATERVTERGPVRAVVRLEPPAPSIGDVVTLTIEVTAEDGIDLLMPEFGQSMDRFSVREFVPKETVDASGRTVASQRYLLEPPLSGPQAIPPLLIEFIDRRPGQRPAPEGEESYELTTERIPFEVASVVPAGASDELRPLRGRLDPLGADRALWPWLLGALLLAAMLAPLAWKRLVAARALGRRRSAWDLARARLDALASKPRPGDEDSIDAFFVELSALIRRYLEDRFELRAPELTTEEFLQVASASPDLGDEKHQGFLRDFLRRADMVKFARFIPPPEDIESALAAASRFLDETHEVETREAGANVRGHGDPAARTVQASRVAGADSGGSRG